MIDQPVAALPRYRCHKEVWALKIEAVTGLELVPTDKRFLPIAVTGEWLAKHKPEAGGYWVQYKDGYTSYSPAQAFEEGYSLIEPITERNWRGETFTRPEPGGD